MIWRFRFSRMIQDRLSPRRNMPVPGSSAYIAREILTRTPVRFLDIIESPLTASLELPSDTPPSWVPQIFKEWCDVLPLAVARMLPVIGTWTPCGPDGRYNHGDPAMIRMGSLTCLHCERPIDQPGSPHVIGEGKGNPDLFSVRNYVNGLNARAEKWAKIEAINYPAGEGHRRSFPRTVWPLFGLDQ